MEHPWRVTRCGVYAARVHMHYIVPSDMTESMPNPTPILCLPEHLSLLNATVISPNHQDARPLPINQAFSNLHAPFGSEFGVACAKLPISSTKYSRISPIPIERMWA
jgi:hypothetical protein